VAVLSPQNAAAVGASSCCGQGFGRKGAEAVRRDSIWPIVARLITKTLRARRTSALLMRDQKYMSSEPQ
jgi:hypothetical protein